MLVLMSMAAWVTPAMAEYTEPVPSHAMAGGVDLYGMSATDASAQIASATAPAGSLRLQVKAASKSYSLRVGDFARTDLDAMLAAAYATTDTVPFELQRKCRVFPAAISAKVASIARAVNRSPVDAAYLKRDGKLKFRDSEYGRRLNTSSARWRLTVAIRSRFETDAPRPTVTMPVSTLYPDVYSWDLGRAIIVDVSARRLRLYDHEELLKSYPVAVGTPGHPTPLGTFEIVKKSPAPAWHNPGSAWAKNMPAYIPPGPNNPLGLRALYLNSPGIRIHGTSNIRSLGTAASHGCIRVANSNIVKLYPLVPIGTVVYIVH